MRFQKETGDGRSRAKLSFNCFEICTCKEEPFFVAFMDLSQAFDSVKRGKLWNILYQIGIDINLVAFLRDLHSNTFAAISIDGQGGLSRSIG